MSSYFYLFLIFFITALTQCAGWCAARNARSRLILLSASVFSLSLDALCALLAAESWPAFSFLISWPAALVWVVLFAILALAALLVCRLLKPLFSRAEGLCKFWILLLSPLFFWLENDRGGQTEKEDAHALYPASAAEDAPVSRNEVLENALELNSTTIDEICTHRSEMVSLSLKDDPSSWRQTILKNRHTFYPITNESGDDIVGVLDTRDYFRMSGVSKNRILEKTVDRPFFVSENTTADELLKMMKQRKTYFSIILDEYGGVSGIVTLHDIVEELFGDMPEAEDAKRQADIVRLPKGVWRISGEADLEDVSKALGIHLELDEFETFSGYILGTLGYIPEDGTQFETCIGPLSIQIKSIRGHRIRQTLVRMEEPAPSCTDPAGQNAQSRT